MDERRAAVRKRVIYGAVIATQGDGRCYNCVVKNWSDLGARVEFAERTELTDDFALIVPQTGLSYRGRVVWVRDNAVGIAFTSAPSNTYIPDDALDAQMQATKDNARMLNRRVNELLGQG